MRLDDILHFNSCNYDKMTETYQLGFYMEYLAKWPELCNVLVDYPGSWGGEGKERIVGYGMLLSLFRFSVKGTMLRGQGGKQVPRTIGNEKNSGIG
jgi:N-terminal acetyltransferase B complex catalytic subunit